VKQQHVSAWEKGTIHPDALSDGGLAVSGGKLVKGLTGVRKYR